MMNKERKIASTLAQKQRKAKGKGSGARLPSERLVTIQQAKQDAWVRRNLLPPAMAAMEVAARSQGVMRGEVAALENEREFGELRSAQAGEEGDAFQQCVIHLGEARR